MSYTVNTLRTMTRSCEMMRDRVKSVVFKPEDRKVLDLTFGPTAAAELVGRTPEALAKAEKEGRLSPPKQLGNGRRYYTLEDLTKIREALHIRPAKRQMKMLLW
ncbi:MerR family transcriptional regulator [Novosphingobium sp. NBM11]|uniref:MerR family transcriptional regulator n=1 Tax=Novosphingobium sp. NBM11 TaxID=2596914 RepID=UPI0021043B8D|nr:MerR family transcriptional regulator [Novosphingobium sp. NBM11]